MAKKEFTVRRVRDEDDRKTGSADYLTLDEGEKFLGYALFEGDPKEDEPGYFEFLEHWHQAARRSVPCAGDDCQFCEDGDRPRNRAKSLWFVHKDNKGSVVDKVMTFNLNSKIIKLITELRGEGDKIKGIMFRVSLLDDRGSYSLVPKAGEKLSAKDIKEHLKDAPDWEAILTGQLKKAMEGQAIAKAMDDDDDDPDEDEPTPAAKKGGKGKGKDAEPEPEDPEEQEWPDDGLDEAEVEVAKVEKEGNWIEVTSESYEGKIKVWTTEGIEFDLSELDKGDTVTISTGEKDSDGEYVLSGEPETAGAGGGEDPDGDDNLPDTIEGDVFEILTMDASESIMDVKNDELEFTLYFIDTVKVDFDDYEVGDKIVVNAEKDTSGDLVATETPTKKKAGKSGKGGKGKGK